MFDSRKDQDIICIQYLFVLVVVFLFHSHFFDEIVRVIIDYDVYHVNVFVNEDQKLTRREMYWINIIKDKNKTNQKITECATFASGYWIFNY